MGFRTEREGDSQGGYVEGHSQVKTPELLKNCFGEIEKFRHSGYDFVKEMELWKCGEMGSSAFFPLILARIFSSSNLSIGQRPITDFSTERILDGDQIRDLFTLGLEGKNPLSSDWPHFRFFQKRPLRGLRGSLDDLKVRELSMIDENLPSSLPAHMYFCEVWPLLYVRHKEDWGFRAYRDLFENQVPDMSGFWMMWLLTEQLLTAFARDSVEVLLPYTDTSMTRVFGSLEGFQALIARSFYFLGWQQRLLGHLEKFKKLLFPDEETYNRFAKTTFSQNGDVGKARLSKAKSNRLQASPPKNGKAVESLEEKTPLFQSGEAYKVMRNSIFLSMKGGKVKAFERVFVQAKSGGCDKAKQELAKICAEAFLAGYPSPLKQWAIGDLGIEDKIEEQIEKLRREINEERRLRREQFLAARKKSN